MSKTPEKNPRLGKVGGQAVIEGVMMKSGQRTATACRHANGAITVVKNTFVSKREKNKFWNLPILRGVVNFIEMMLLSFKTINISADAFLEEEEPKKEQKPSWMKKHLGFSGYDLAMALSMVLGLGLALVLFLWLPTFLADLLVKEDTVWKSLLEGGLKVAIFVSYLLLTLLMRDMRRVFAYHGAEHKCVACYEAGDPLTPEYAKKHTRFHPRCGTSFMFVMILLGILVGFAIRLIFPEIERWLYVSVRLLILPLVVGVGYEFIRFAGNHNGFVVRALSAPGLWMQRITTREPDEEMLEIALTALMCAIPEEFPDFDETTYDRSKKGAKTESENEECDAPHSPSDFACGEATSLPEGGSAEAQNTEDETL